MIYKQKMMQTVKNFAKKIYDGGLFDSGDFFIIGGFPRRLFFDQLPEQENYEIDIDLAMTDDSANELINFVSKEISPIKTSDKTMHCFDYDGMRFEMLKRRRRESRYDGIAPFNVVKGTPLDGCFCNCAITNINCFYLNLKDFVGGNTINEIPIYNYVDKAKYYFGETEKFKLIVDPIFNLKEPVLEKDMYLEISRISVKEMISLICSNINVDDHTAKCLIEYTNSLHEMQFNEYNKNGESLFDLYVKDTYMKQKVCLEKISLEKIAQLRGATIVKIFDKYRNMKLDKYHNIGHHRLCERIDEIVSKSNKIISIGIIKLDKDSIDKDLLLITNEANEPKVYCNYRSNNLEDYYEFGFHDGADWNRVFVPIELTRTISLCFYEKSIVIFEGTFWTGRFSFIDSEYNVNTSESDKLYISPAIKNYDIYDLKKIDDKHNSIKFMPQNSPSFYSKFYLDYDVKKTLLYIFLDKDDKAKIFVYPSSEYAMNRDNIKINLTETLAPLILFSVKDCQNCTYELIYNGVKISSVFNHFRMALS